jgi:cytochrome c biogenesis protein CcmG, thiol:disulfide interchange protein DsbE
MSDSYGAMDARTVQRSLPIWAFALPMLVVVAAVAIAVMLLTMGRSPSVSGGPARVGVTAPAFSTWDLSGKPVNLTDFRGRPVLLTFWATGCAACKEELPALQGIQDRYQSTGLTVLAVNYGETNDVRMSQYLAALHVNLKAVIDPKGTIAHAYGVFGLPITVLVDRKGRVGQIIIGLVPSAVLEDAVARITGQAAMS